MEKGTGSVLYIIDHAGYMRDNGSMIIGMGEVLNATVMVTSMKVTSETINLTEKVFTLGSMEKCTKASGKMDLKKGKAFGKVFLEIHISVSGLRVKLMGTEFTSGRMGIDTKVNGNYVLNMAKAQIFSQMQMFTPASTKTENHTGSANTNGKILLSTSENSALG